MKRGFSGQTWMLGVLPMLLVWTPRVQAESITIPEGTEVRLAFDKAISSKTAKPGDRVPLHVTEDVVVDGQTILKEGAKVTGVISQVEKRKRFGVNAKLQITLNPVRSVSGTPIPLEPKDKGKYTGSRTDQAAMASGGGALVLGPLGLIGGYFVVGKPVNIKPGDSLVTEVARDIAIAK